MSRPNWKRYRVHLRRFNRRAITVFSLLKSKTLSFVTRTTSVVFRPFVSRFGEWNKNRLLRKRPGYFSTKRRIGIVKRMVQRIGVRSIVFALIACAVVVGNLMINVHPVGADATQIARQSKRDGPAPPPLPEDSTLHLEGQVALMLEVAMLKEAISKLDDVDNYTCTFEKQERIEGELSELQQQFTKIRHRPFSVYFKVEKGSVGREILYPMGPDDPRMIVKLPTLGGRIPAIKLDPSSTRAMSESRYPITMAGIKELTKMTLNIRQHDLKIGKKVRTQLRDDLTFDGRPVYCYQMTYASPKANKIYRKCVLYIDKSLMVPVYVRNFTWADAVPDSDLDNFDEATLVEYYTFRDIKLNAGLIAMDFDFKNKKYPFH